MSSPSNPASAEPTASILVHRSVKRTLFGMAFPMLAGTFAMNAYNLTDTWFVSLLGTRPLAAMSFSFPVVMLLTCVAMGLGNGAMTLVSHAIGRHDTPAAARLTTHGLLLIVLVSILMSLAGYATIRPVFARLGADAPTLALVSDYMRIWYLGALFMALPMIGNGLLISCGDSKRAGRIMMVGPALNAILDPIMIFGWLGCPALGLRGAALATVIAQAVSAIFLLRALHIHHHLILWGRDALAGWTASIRRIMTFAIPGMLSMMLMPLSSSVITRLLGSYGTEAVAAAGAAGRLEMFAFIIPMALGISLTPFISQNFGAQRLDRIREALRFSTLFALWYGFAIALIFYVGAPHWASIFSQDPRVIEIMVCYIRIVSFGYGMMEIHRYGGFVLNGLHQPRWATALNAVRVLVLLIPFVSLGSYFGGLQGIFWGRLSTDVLAGMIAWGGVYRRLHPASRAP